jgi:hypothetical protein
VTPNSPVDSNNLLCNITSSSDTDNDTLQYYFKWYNGTALILSAGPLSSTTHTLGAGNTSGNDTWRCNATAFDGTANSTEGTDFVNISAAPINNLPTSPIVNVTPETATTIDDLLCSITVNSTDADNQSISYYFSWNNGTDFIRTIGPVNSTFDILTNNYTFKHQNWNCSVIPTDGIGNGTAGFDNATIQNTLPVNNATIPGQTWLWNTNKTDAFDLDNHFTDADNDALLYIYSQVENITNTINTNSSVTFVPDTNFTGTRTDFCSANDTEAKTDSANFTLNVITCGDSICDAAYGESCSTCPADCGTCPTACVGCGGGGGRRRRRNTRNTLQ